MGLNWGALHRRDRIARSNRDAYAEGAHLRAVARADAKRRLILERREEGFACPRCPSGALFERHRKRDGHAFLGCSGYPTCRHSEDLR